MLVLLIASDYRGGPCWQAQCAVEYGRAQDDLAQLAARSLVLGIGRELLVVGQVLLYELVNELLRKMRSQGPCGSREPLHI